MSSEHTVRFSLGGLLFEYDEEKNRKNIEKHGMRVFSSVIAYPP